MSIHNANYKKRPFKPHLTIAFRDLKKSQFPKAWEFYKHRPFKSACEIDGISLLKHDGKQWQSEREFKFLKP
jgi:2'-5' RNA ligase